MSLFRGMRIYWALTPRSAATTYKIDPMATTHRKKRKALNLERYEVLRKKCKS